MRRSTQGAIPSDVGWLVEELASLSARLDTLEAPSGESLANSVAKLQDLVANLQTYLDDYIATDLPALVAAEVAAQLSSAFAGSITIGGNLQVNGTLTANGAVRFPNVPATTFVVEPRAVVWVDTSNGRLGRT